MNKYLEKIAFLSKFRSKRERDLLDLAGFTMSGTGLAIGANNYVNNKKNLQSSEQKAKLEEQSLAALKNINRTLQKNV